MLETIVAVRDWCESIKDILGLTSVTADDAPSGTSTPYLVIEPQNMSLETRDSEVDLDTDTLEFQVFSLTQLEARTILENLERRLQQRQRLAILDGYMISVERSGQTNCIKEGKHMFRAFSSWDIRVQRSRED